MLLVESVPVTLVSGTGGMTATKSPEDAGTESEAGCVTTAQAQEAYCLQSPRRNDPEQSCAASSCLQAVATGIWKVKKSQSQSHQKKIFETLRKSKQTSRGGSAVQSRRKTEGAPESLCSSGLV